MMTLKRILAIIALCMATCTLWAQNEVSLVVSGEGQDKEEATLKALRSAIEQAYGTFVSANTTVLNDRLVADEIVSLSSGNIQKYEYVSEAKMPDGSTFVTLSATVSIDKLVSFAESKGMEAELKGGLFAMNIKKMEFDKQAEEKAMANLCKQLEAMLPTLFDYEIEVGEPSLSHISVAAFDCGSENRKCIESYIENCIDEELDLIKTEIHVVSKKNKNFDYFYDILTKNLMKLLPDKLEVDQYKKMNYPLYWGFRKHHFNLSLLAAQQHGTTKQDCPQINCPGLCGRFEDSDGNGFCDHGGYSEYGGANNSNWDFNGLYFRSDKSFENLFSLYVEFLQTLCHFIVEDDLHQMEVYLDCDLQNKVIECTKCRYDYNRRYYEFVITPSWLCYNLNHSKRGFKNFRLSNVFWNDYSQFSKSSLKNYNLGLLNAKLLSGAFPSHPIIEIVGNEYHDGKCGGLYLFAVWNKKNKIDLLYNNIYTISNDINDEEISYLWGGYHLGTLCGISTSVDFKGALYYTQEEISKITHISVRKPAYTENNSTVPSTPTNTSNAKQPQPQSKITLYNDTLQQAVNEYNTLLRKFPYNYNENKIAFVLSSSLPDDEGFLRDTLYSLLDTISAKRAQLVARYKKDSLEFKQLNNSLQEKIDEANVQFLKYPYNLQKRTLKDSLSISLFGKTEELTKQLHTKVAALPQLQEQAEKEVYDETKKNNPQRFTEIYFTQNPTTKQKADSTYLECRCGYSIRHTFDMDFINNALPECNCREKKYQDLKTLYHSREEFDQSYNQVESAFESEVTDRKKMWKEIKKMDEMLSNWKQLNTKKALSSTKTEIIYLLSLINQHQGGYYYNDAVDVIFAYDEKLSKEWDKNGSYFKSKNEMFEYWIGEGYDKVLKARKKE